MRVVASAWLPFVLALAVSACGDDSTGRLTKSGYQAAILEIAEDSSKANSLYTDLVAERRPQSECADGVRTLHDEIAELINRVDSLQPPQNVETLQEQFVAAANESLERVQEVGDQVAAGKVSCGRQLNDLIYGLPSSDRADRAISELEERGYYVFGD